MISSKIKNFKINKVLHSFSLSITFKNRTTSSNFKEIKHIGTYRGRSSYHHSASTSEQSFGLFKNQSIPQKMVSRSILMQIIEFCIGSLSS